ncbi:NADase-type glycan-binding domain-containing protein [Rhodococcus sp. NPDC059234]|uniref:NADase-type glycan-binding domain-containing protein n=1 Tax=Rhodococcus sp. NPDC059234 TaxID=3346781 RepID=UPI00366C647E
MTDGPKPGATPPKPEPAAPAPTTPGTAAADAPTTVIPATAAAVPAPSTDPDQPPASTVDPAPATPPPTTPAPPAASQSSPPPYRPPLSVRGWLAVLAAVAIVVALLGGGGYLLNRALTQDNSTTVAGSATAESDGSDGSSDTTTGSTGPTNTMPVTPTGVVAACATYPPAVDSAGRPHTYEAPNATDGDLTTAWRCRGTQGQSLSISFVCAQQLATVGIDPGHDKTDADGSDRFAQNRKITRVTWTFDDGSTVEQELKPERGIQTLEVDKTSRTAKLTVVSTVDGQPITNRTGEQFAPFNDVTSVSEVRFTARAGDGGDGCAK